MHVRTAGAVGYFGMLAVYAEAQGAGLGRSLLEAAEDNCRRAGCSTMTLSTAARFPSCHAPSPNW